MRKYSSGKRHEPWEKMIREKSGYFVQILLAMRLTKDVVSLTKDVVSGESQSKSFFTLLIDEECENDVGKRYQTRPPGTGDE